MKATSPPHSSVLSWSSSSCSTRSHNCDTHSRPSLSHFLHCSPASRALGNETAHSRICGLHVRPGYSDVGDVVFVFASHLKSVACKATFKMLGKKSSVPRPGNVPLRCRNSSMFYIMGRCDTSVLLIAVQSEG